MRCVHLPRVFGVSGHSFRRLCERVPTYPISLSLSSPLSLSLSLSLSTVRKKCIIICTQLVIQTYLLGTLDILFIYKISSKVYKISKKKM